MQPETFGKYLLLSRLGSGGMAEVFLARTQSIGGFEKLLAIKRLLPFCTQDAETVDLLADEARITVRLTHPNIVQVFDFGRVGESYYIAMEYVDGCDLKSLIRIDETASSPMDLSLALYVTGCILDALDFAHTQRDSKQSPLGIIHRDVSPHNVLISHHGQVKLTDFGVARAAISCHVTRVGDIRGKFSYMPPEQVCGGTIDHRVDVFAVGAILYELLAGRQPYRSASAGEQLQLLRFEMQPPSALRTDLPRELDAVCMRALDKDPAHRFASAAEFAAALRDQALRLGGSALPPTAALAELVERRAAEIAAERPGERSELMALATTSASSASPRPGGPAATTTRWDRCAPARHAASGSPLRRRRGPRSSTSTPTRGLRRCWRSPPTSRTSSGCSPSAPPRRPRPCRRPPRRRRRKPTRTPTPTTARRSSPSVFPRSCSPTTRARPARGPTRRRPARRPPANAPRSCRPPSPA